MRAWSVVVGLAVSAVCTPLAACDADDGSNEGTTPAGEGRLGRDAGSSTPNGLRPWRGSPSGAVGSSDADDARDAAADDMQTTTETDPELALCDGDCSDSSQCDSGQQCIAFAAGMKCAPAECTSCTLGCVFDLQTCTFTRCVAEPPPDAPDSCGATCQTAADCADGQVCNDVFGLGECAPPECEPCEGYCDYNPMTCAFDACYIGGGPTADPFYCGHQF
jgi:hypothetical protein